MQNADHQFLKPIISSSQVKISAEQGIKDNAKQAGYQHMKPPASLPPYVG